MEWISIPEGKDPLTHRGEMCARFGVYTYDLLRTEWACPRCATPVEGPEPMVIPLINYRTLADAETLLIRSIKATLARPDAAPECPSCDQAADLKCADHHLFHSGLGVDLVLRFHPGSSPEVERHCWSLTDGLRPLGELDAKALGLIRRDALLRAAGAYKEHGQDRELAAVLAEAANAIPGEGELMRFLPRLCALGETGLVQRIAADRMRLAADHADGYFWSAEILIEAAAAQGASSPALAVAEPLLSRALELQPDYPDAEVALANVARVRGLDGEAERILRGLLTRHPTHGVASYTLGLVRLQPDPADALSWFTVSETALPEDADPPRGRARALLSLARPGEALAAALRAKQLAPSDPRVASLVVQCAGAISAQKG
jgi:hypothetical protein